MNQFEFVQYETEPIEAQDPFQRFEQGNYEIKSFEEGVSVVVVGGIALAAWFTVAWTLPHKMGRKSRWVWFGLLACPYTMFFSLLVLTLSPSPVTKANKEAEGLEKELESTKNQLEASQQQVKRYMDYVTKANSVIEKLQSERMNHG